ncbi:MAG: glycerol-3-phosphate acyltransferase, partial [Actinomycetota bacterium]|nr:glycerol-3-phosphate acyltransferase [Actinomycetota bacterium]
MPVVLMVLAYLLGTLPSAMVVAGRQGVDPTTAGSGNPGATNVYRTAGRWAGLAVFLADAGKGAGAATLGLLVGGRPLGLAC